MSPFLVVLRRRNTMHPMKSVSWHPAKVASFLLVLVCLIGIVRPGNIYAQGIPSIVGAENDFEAGVRSFESGSYDAAYQSFRKVVDSYDLNQKTTAARLMAGKALYRMGQYDGAIDSLERFIRAFPRSRYVESARRTMALAREAEKQIGEMADVLQIGVLLPTTADDISLTQALFNGFRLAVDQHNESDDGKNLVRMVFAPSTGTMEETFQDFSDAGVTLVFGPLYSREAVEAARLAEEHGIVMLTPLATDEDVSDGLRFVFQANPTPSMRGRLMAKFAVESLTMDELAVVAEYNNSLSERMAEGFQDEVERLGKNLRVVKMLNGSNGWFRLADELKEDSLAGIDAIYLPITGGKAPSLIKAAMDNVDRLGLTVKLLGNKEWDGLSNRTQASKYLATYTNDYYVDSENPLVEAFRSTYETLASEEPNQLAFVGYDLGRFLTRVLVTDDGRDLMERIRFAPPFQGLAVKVNFGGGNVNQAMFYERYRNGRTELLR